MLTCPTTHSYPTTSKCRRAVAIDLVGFGRSDKPARRQDYSFQAHVDWTWAAIHSIGLQGITLVCQDWGGLIGLRLAGEHPEHFARIVDGGCLSDLAPEVVAACEDKGPELAQVVPSSSPPPRGPDSSPAA